MKKLSLKRLGSLISASLAAHATSVQAAVQILDPVEPDDSLMPQADVLNHSVSTMVAGHRSHSSHSSHSSHRSSGGGGYSAPRSAPPASTPPPRSDPRGQPAKPQGSYPNKQSSSVPTDKEQLKVLIMRVQIALKQKGYYTGSLDGQMGPKTREAIGNYRQVHMLSKGGLLDADLLNSLGISGF